jgi:hypothetical protein
MVMTSKDLRNLTFGLLVLVYAASWATPARAHANCGKTFDFGGTGYSYQGALNACNDGWDPEGMCTAYCGEGYTPDPGGFRTCDANVCFDGWPSNTTCHPTVDCKAPDEM